MATTLATESAEVRREVTADGPIVFYDGDCGLCARIVRLVLRRDQARIFRFAPLQGETAEKLIGPPTGKPDAWSFVLLDETGAYGRSTGALKVLQLVKWGGFLPALGMIVPRPIRDWVYGVVAKVRYRVWGRVDRCALMTPEERHRFLP